MKKILGLLIVLLVCAAMLPALASAETSGTWGDNLTWVLDDEGTLTINGTGEMTDFSWDSTSAWLAETESINEVVIEDGVTSISHRAFYGCRSLTSITLPDGITSIGDYAFAWCDGLTSITLPESVTSIGRNAFSDCKSLTSITIPEDVTSIGEQVFAFCISLTSITLPDGVTSIGKYAFDRCSSLTSITLPEGLTSIGGSAFIDCFSLTSITLPDGITSIGDWVFAWCDGLTSITLPDGVTSIGTSVFYGCSSLTSITLPDSVTSIGEDAIPKTTTIQCHRNTYADKWATENGYNIDYLPCAEHTVVIDAAVEPTCTETGLTEGSHCSVCGEVMTAQAEVPAKGHSYGEPTYEWSADNKTVTASRICANDASHVESETVNVSEAVTREATRDEEGERTYTAIFNNTAFTEQTRTEKIPALTPVENPTESPQSEQPSEPEQPIQSDEPVAPIEQPVEQVPIEQQPSDQVPGEMVPTGPVPGPHADDTGNYTINADLTATYEGPAKKVSKVKTATIPDEIVVERFPVKVTAIADKAFYKAKKLTKVTIGANVKTIGKSAFASCAKLKTVSGGSGVVTIGASAFKGDKSLTKITIGKKVTTIGKSAFNGCKKLKTVTIKATKLKKVGSSAFKGVASSVTFKCPSKQLKAYKKLIKKAGAPGKAKYKK